jgi:murein L,D-transpeptidase YcbB/YkuD
MASTRQIMSWPLPATASLDGDDLDAAVMQFEMELSAAALTYVLDATRGRVDPNRISQYHDLPRHDVDLVAALEEFTASGNVATALEAHQPQSDHFKKLTAELARLKAEDEEADQIVIAPGTFLKAGKSSPEMKNIVAAISKHGSETLKTDHAATLAAYDGSDLYTPELVALVKSFQKESKLTADGIVGKNTIKAMVGETNAAKIAKVELAMERSRWLPEELGERKVFINQPAFTATYYEPGTDPMSMRVVVGKKSNQTNFFYDKIEIVEYNPYWGVPYSIIVNEMIPKLAANPSYLDQAGYEVTTPGGRKVSSASVDWYAVANKQKSINVRQYPGRSNALGEVKILFPNRHHIYMHDTPSKSLFNKDTRAFSHGCIRLHDPKGMAAAVLGKSTDYVSSRIAAGQNAQEKVTGDIPVYVSYFTAWPEADGSIGFYTDVYDRDRYLLKALEKTEEVRAKARAS